MKDVMKRIAQSPIAECNKFKVLSHIKSVAVAELNGDRVLVYINGETLEFYNSAEDKINEVYADYSQQLANCMPKPTPKVELLLEGDCGASWDIQANDREVYFCIKE